SGRNAAVNRWRRRWGWRRRTRHAAAARIAAALRRNHLIEIRRSHFAAARPLIVKLAICVDGRPRSVGRRELSRHRFERQRLLRERAVEIGMKRRTAVSRTIDDVHAEPRLKQIRDRSEEHTSELQSLAYLVCRLLLEK